jgi:hypothetical protein
MAKKIRIISGENVLEAELNDSKTANGIEKLLPIKGSANRWGKEIYFSINFSADYENPTEIVEKGDLAFWPAGNAFCIFWGRTPASVGDEIRAASDVNVFGKITSGVEILEQDKIKSGDPITIELA